MLLDFFRRRQKTVYWVLLPAIVIPFVFYYGGSGLAPGAGADPAEFMNRLITPEEIGAEMARCFGREPGIRRDPLARAMALNRLISVMAVRQSGLAAGDAEVDRALDRQRAGTEEEPRFPQGFWSFDGASLYRDAQEGQFERVRALVSRFAGLYQQRLAAWTAGRLTRQEYDDLREATREEILLWRHARLLSGTAKTTAPELFQAYVDQHTRLKARYARLDLKACEELVPTQELSEETLKGFFEARKDRPGSQGGYQVPERASIAWLLADRERIGKEIPVDPADVEAFYASRKESWKDPATNAPKPLDAVREEVVRELNRDKVLNRIDDLVLEALASPQAEPFAETAKRLPSLAEGAGTVELSEPKVEALGYVAGLREALEGVDPGGRLGKPLDCAKGRVVIRLLSREPAHAPALDEVRSRVAGDLRKHKARQAGEDLLMRLKAALKPDNTSNNFEGACADLIRNPTGSPTPPPKPFTGLTSGITEPFEKDGPFPEPLKGIPEAARAAFDLKGEGESGDPHFSDDDSEGVLLQLAERIPPPPEGFLKERAKLAERYQGWVSQALQRDWRGAVDSRTRLRAPRGKAVPPIEESHDDEE